jgi:DNA repair exonuclease SbcCD nuclease subunit
MNMEFIHVADVHLGYEQYGSHERFLDFGDAFNKVVNYAIENNVDFFLISGDLFNKRNINPKTLIQATAILRRLKESGIPVIAIEGNHDRALYGDKLSWMNYLSKEGYIHLLNVKIEESGVKLNPWNERSRSGGYVEIGDVRIIGIRYYGASTSKVLEMVEDELRALRDGKFTILMLHAGMERYMPYAEGGLGYDQLSKIRNFVDYVALGHIHKHYEVGGWIFNPGSLENWNSQEVGWRKGFFHIKLKNDALEVKHIESERRPFLKEDLDIGALKTPSEIMERIKTLLNSLEIPNGCIFELNLKGSLLFDRSELRVEEIEEILKERGVLIPRVNLNVETNSMREVAEKREDVERSVLRELVRRYSQYSEILEDFVSTIMSLRRIIPEDPSAEEILSILERGIWKEEEIWDWRRAFADKKN